MVSVHEQFFIDQLASESSSDKEEVSIGSDLTDLPKVSDVHTEDKNSSPVLRRQYDQNHLDKNRMCDETENANSSFTSESSLCSDSSIGCTNGPLRKKVMWNKEVVDRINGILNNTSLKYSTSSSSTEGPEKILAVFSDGGFRRSGALKRNSYKSDESVLDNVSDSSDNFVDTSIHKQFGEQWNSDNGLEKRNIRRPSGISFKLKKGKHDHDAIVNSVCMRARLSEGWIRANQPQIAVLGDSHTRLLGGIIAQMLSGFKVDATVKPGAKSKRVISSLEEILVCMARNDFVVIITGTNDMWSESLEEVKSIMYDAVHSSSRTNLILCNVPNNYMEARDSPVQENIYKINKYYEDIVSCTNNTHLVNLHELKNRNLFTRHGLHFNQSGKVKICEAIAHKILDIIDSIKSSV